MRVIYGGVEMRPKRNDKQTDIDELFSKVKDEYDAIVVVGKLMEKYDVTTKTKDSIKTIVKELIDFGFNLGYKEGLNSKA